MDNENKNGREGLEEQQDAKTALRKYFTPFKIAELVICLVAIAAGIVYLINDSLIPLYVLLPFFACCFVAVPVLRIIDMKKNSADGSGMNRVSVITWCITAALVIAATVLYFINRK